MVVENAYRPRRTCLSVPGSNPKMIEKAKKLPADEVFLDLEDAVAPDAKAEARTQVAVALAEPGWAGQLRGVRVNDWTTPWTYSDVIEAVSTAGASLDIVVLPKVTDVSHIHALDLLLGQLEATHGLPVGRIGIEAQIENAQGLTNIDAIAAGPRVQALILGTGGHGGEPEHAHPGGRRAAGGLRRRRRASPCADADPDRRPHARRPRDRRAVSEDP